jgi:hypothetical protein
MSDTPTTKRQAFYAETVRLAGRELRPMTAGTLNFLEQTRSVLLSASLEGVDRLALCNAAVVYALLHSKPWNEVKPLVDNPKALEAEGMALMFEIPIEDAEALGWAINAYLVELRYTRDWEVADSGGSDPTAPSGQLST